MDVSNSKPVVSVDSAILILAFTAGAYAIAFAYERAYIAAFGLPSHLVEIDLKSILFAGAGVMGAVVVVQILSVMLALLPSSWPPQIRGRFTGRLAHPTLFAIVLALIGPHPRTWVNLASWSSVAFMLAVNAVGIRSEVKKYRARGEEYLKEIEKFDQARASPGPVWRWGEERLGVEGMRAALIFFMSLWVATLVGAGHAQREQIFLVSSSTKPCVVVREYRGTLICAVVDDSLKRLTGGYLFIPDGLSERLFTLRAAGPFERAPLPVTSCKS